MERAIVVKGRVVGPTTVELDEPIGDVVGTVDVVLRLVDAERSGTDETIFAFLRRLPAGRRSREEIDRQVHTEREAWDDR